MWLFKMVWHKSIFWHGNMFRPLKANIGYKEYVQDEPIFVLSIVSASYALDDRKGIHSC